MTSHHRIDNHSITKNNKITISFDGKEYHGYEGDSLASILMAHHVKLVGRSFKYHRPRGILSAGSEEPNALVEHREGDYKEPNTRMTTLEAYDHMVAYSQNRFPHLRFDVWSINSFFSSLLPSGFYYKTFMWPRKFWEPFYEKIIRHAAGLGKAGKNKDPDTYAHKHHFCDILIVGGGVSGLMMAKMLSKTHLDITLLDEDYVLGGSFHYHDATIEGLDAQEWVDKTARELASLPNVTLSTRTTVTGYYDHNFLTALEKVTDHLEDAPKHLPRQRFWKIRAEKVILATGMHERPLSFADNDRPGVLLASALGEYMKRYGVQCGKHVLFVTNNDSVYETALRAKNMGSDVTVVDCRKQLSDVAKASQDHQITVFCNHVITRTLGKNGVTAATIHALNDDQTHIAGAANRIYCDYIGMSGGFTPQVHLYSQARGKLAFDDEYQSFFPHTITQKTLIVGALNKQFTIAHIKDDCMQKALFIKDDMKLSGDITPIHDVNETSYDIRPEKFFVFPTTHLIGQGKYKHFIDFQNDVTVADITLAHREGYESVEHLKRYTTTGMGTDQGKTSNVNALTIMAHLKKCTIENVGTTTFRPPFIPLTFGAIAGSNVDKGFMQERGTAMHDSHCKHGAVFEDVGDWKRPFYFPQGEESMKEAVMRECKQVRLSCGMLDASTLGKIDIQGKDSTKLLNLLYTNKWDKLATGKCRYGLMLNENGMVFDDGVTTRIDENHYHMTTTTGGAARVMNWIEEWLQTEFPTWEVYATSVTEQWSVASISGPRARDLLQKICHDDISAENFPFMSYKDCRVADLDARVFRISFTGELSFEINVKARDGATLWERLIEAGKEFNLCLYGTEAMHVLRAEKGYIIVGQDTDGTITPHDLGMSNMVSKTKDFFLGDRSLSREDTQRDKRKQLVGFIPETQDFVPQEGAHIVEDVLDKPPMHMLGYITSSYFSSNLGHSFGLALLEDGRNRIGQKLSVPVINEKTQTILITDPCFYDKNGSKLHG